jgi:hypothetical protein
MRCHFSSGHAGEAAAWAQPQALATPRRSVPCPVARCRWLGLCLAHLGFAAAGAEMGCATVLFFTVSPLGGGNAFGALPCLLVVEGRSGVSISSHIAVTEMQRGSLLALGDFAG